MKNNGSSPGQSPPSPDHPSHYQHCYDDEIDLIDIWRVLVQRWRWIASVTMVCTLLAVAYVLLAPRVYKAEAVILPPKQSDIEPLNISVISGQGGKASGVLQVYAITPDDVYKETFKNLQSLYVRRLFFDKYNLLNHLKVQFGEDVSVEGIFTKGFHEKLTVSQGKKDKSDFVTVALEGGEPQQVTTWINDFIDTVNEYIIDTIKQNALTSLAAKKESVEDKIKALRQVAKSRRLDRIAELEEAFYVASQLGIEHRAEALPPSASSPKENLGLGVAVNTSETPLYLRGMRELQAEIDMLRKRKSDDPFIKPLRSLQEELSQLNQVEVKTDEVKAFRLDQNAIVPEDPIEPKRKLVVALGSVLGLMLGVFAAFVTNFIETARRQDRPT